MKASEQELMIEKLLAINSKLENDILDLDEELAEAKSQVKVLRDGLTAVMRSDPYCLKKATEALAATEPKP